MKNRIKSLKGLFAIGLFLFFSSFIGYENGTFETPGTLTFIGQAGSPNVFTFNRWEIKNANLPEGDFTQVEAEIIIDAGSFECDWKDLENNIRKKKDYFYVKKFPKASVKINGATKQEDGSFITKAKLTLKGKTNPVELHFTVSEEAPYQVTGGGIIVRQKFGFTGDGPKDEVPVDFDFTFPAQ